MNIWLFFFLVNRKNIPRKPFTCRRAIFETRHLSGPVSYFAAKSSAAGKLLQGQAFLRKIKGRGKIAAEYGAQN